MALESVDQWPAAPAKPTGELTGIHDPVAERAAFRVPPETPDTTSSRIKCRKMIDVVADISLACLQFH